MSAEFKKPKLLRKTKNVNNNVPAPEEKKMRR